MPTLTRTISGTDIVYKSNTGYTVTVGRYQVTPEPGVRLRDIDPQLEELCRDSEVSIATFAQDPITGAVTGLVGPDGGGITIRGGSVYDIRRSGCVAGVGQNNTAQLNAAFAAAAASGVPAYIPSGDWYYSPASDGEMLSCSCSILGDGTSSRLVCDTADGNRSRLNIPENAADLFYQDFHIYSPNSASVGDERGIGLRANPGATRLKFTRLHFTNTKGAPILLRGVTDSQVSGVFVNTSWKDCVHVTGASQNIQISDVFARNAGDDTVAVVGYVTNGVYPQDISITNVHVNGSVQGRGVAVVGGRRVRVTGVYGYRVFGSVVYAASEAGYNTYPTEDVQFSKVIGVECGQISPALAGLHVTGRAGSVVSRVSFDDVLLINSRWRGIVVAYGKDIVLRNVRSLGNAASTGLEVSNTDNFSFVGGGIEASQRGGLFVANTVTGKIELRDLVFRDIAAGYVAGDDVILIAGSSTASDIVIDNISHPSQATTIERFIENNNAGITRYGAVSSVIEGRSGTSPFAIGIPNTAVTVTASPFVYQNATNDTLILRLIGGTISQIRRSSDGTNWFAAPASKGLFVVRPGHRVEVTYSVAPTAEIRPQSLV